MRIADLERTRRTERTERPTDTCPLLGRRIRELQGPFDDCDSAYTLSGLRSDLGEPSIF